MIGTAAFIFVWFIGFIVATTFELKVFTNRTSEFLFLTFGFALVLIACVAILHVSLNISLIADSKINELGDDDDSTFSLKWFFVGAALLFACFTAFLFLTDHWSSTKDKNRFIGEALTTIGTFDNSINNMIESLADTSRIGMIPSVLNLMSNNNNHISEVLLITHDFFDDQFVSLQITSRISEASLKQPYFSNAFYRCSGEVCAYLNKVFLEGHREPHFRKVGIRYNYFHPVEHDGKTVVLLFRHSERYGSIGK